MEKRKSKHFPGIASMDEFPRAQSTKSKEFFFFFIKIKEFHPQHRTQPISSIYLPNKICALIMFSMYLNNSCIPRLGSIKQSE